MLDCHTWSNASSILTIFKLFRQTYELVGKLVATLTNAQPFFSGVCSVYGRNSLSAELTCQIQGQKLDASYVGLTAKAMMGNDFIRFREPQWGQSSSIHFCPCTSNALPGAKTTSRLSDRNVTTCASAHLPCFIIKERLRWVFCIWVSYISRKKK